MPNPFRLLLSVLGAFAPRRASVRIAKVFSRFSSRFRQSDSKTPSETQRNNRQEGRLLRHVHRAPSGARKSKSPKQSALARRSYPDLPRSPAGFLSPFASRLLWPRGGSQIVSSKRLAIYVAKNAICDAMPPDNVQRIGLLADAINSSPPCLVEQAADFVLLLIQQFQLSRQ